MTQVISFPEKIDSRNKRAMEEKVESCNHSSPLSMDSNRDSRNAINFSKEMNFCEDRFLWVEDPQHTRQIQMDNFKNGKHCKTFFNQFDKSSSMDSEMSPQDNNSYFSENPNCMNARSIPNEPIIVEMQEECPLEGERNSELRSYWSEEFETLKYHEWNSAENTVVASEDNTLKLFPIKMSNKVFSQLNDLRKLYNLDSPDTLLSFLLQAHDEQSITRNFVESLVAKARKPFMKLPIDLRLYCLSFIPHTLSYNCKQVKTTARSFQSVLSNAHDHSSSFTQFASSTFGKFVDDPNIGEIYLLYKYVCYDACSKYHHFNTLVSWGVSGVQMEGISRSWMKQALQSIIRHNPENEPKYDSFQSSDSDDDDYNVWNRIRSQQFEQASQYKSMEYSQNLSSGEKNIFHPSSKYTSIYSNRSNNLNMYVHIDITLYRSCDSQLSEAITNLPYYVHLRSIYCRADDYEKLNILLQSCNHLEKLEIATSTGMKTITEDALPALICHPSLQEIKIGIPLSIRMIKDLLTQNPKLRKIQVKQEPGETTTSNRNSLLELVHKHISLKSVTINGEVYK